MRILFNLSTVPFWRIIEWLHNLICCFNTFLFSRNLDKVFAAQIVAKVKNSLETNSGTLCVL